MSVAESSTIDGILEQLRTWPSSDRLRLARKILETLEAAAPVPAPRPAAIWELLGALNTDAPEAAGPTRPLTDLIGILKTDGPAPTDEECRAILEEELLKKHMR